MTRSVLVTGAGGYLGRLLIDSLATAPETLDTIVATDVRDPELRLPGVTYVTLDVRDQHLASVLSEHKVEVVVHLAAIVTPGRNPDRELEHSVDVGGTRNVLESCRAAEASKIIVTSSGAAYGYRADNPEWLDEDDELRGNVEFAYSDHKRQVEEMLATWRTDHPELAQLVFRPGTILGRTTRNQITALFDRPVILGIRGAPSPFVFIWDLDVIECLRRGIFTSATGTFNLAGDGAVTTRQLSERMGKPYLAVPAGIVRGVLWVLQRAHMTQYGPEQVDFLRYRPVLSNRRLKSEFGYTPRRTSVETFDLWAASHAGA
jgi:UDP-glucose 4-epimerase